MSFGSVLSLKRLPFFDLRRMRHKSVDVCAKRFVLAPNNCCVIELEMSPLGTQGRDFVDPINPFSRGPFDFIYEPFSQGPLFYLLLLAADSNDFECCPSVDSV